MFQSSTYPWLSTDQAEIFANDILETLSPVQWYAMSKEQRQKVIGYLNLKFDSNIAEGSEDYDSYYNYVPERERHQAAEQIGDMENVTSWKQRDPYQAPYIYDFGQQLLTMFQKGTIRGANKVAKESLMKRIGNLGAKYGKIIDVGARYGKNMDAPKEYVPGDIEMKEIKPKPAPPPPADSVNNVPISEPGRKFPDLPPEPESLPDIPPEVRRLENFLDDDARSYTFEEVEQVVNDAERAIDEIIESSGSSTDLWHDMSKSSTPHWGDTDDENIDPDEEIDNRVQEPESVEPLEEKLSQAAPEDLGKAFGPRRATFGS